MRRHSHAWAAAAALVIGILALWQTLPDPQIQHAFHAEYQISGIDFESGAIAPQLDSGLAPDVVVTMDFESAIVIASATTVKIAEFDAAPPGSSREKLGGFDFESGYLVGVTPQT